MVFEWDDSKDESNFKKHGIRFAEAATIWSDDRSIEYHDLIHSVDEQRFIRIGQSLKNRILIAIYCERQFGEVIRIISARRATNLEVLEYEK